MATATAPAKREDKEQAASLRDMIEKSTAQFAMLMPKETVEKFKRVAFTTFNDKPELQRCNPRSLLSVMMHAAQDGLMLDGREAAIVPFKSGPDLIATYQPMVVGLRKKIRASGLINTLDCQVVFEGDAFDISFGDRPYVHHKPALTGGSKRNIVGAYSIATFKDDPDSKSIEWMTIQQIEEIRQKSPAVRSKRATPWDDPVFYPEMCRKTVMRRHAKSLPMASDVENIFRHEAESFESAAGVPIEERAPRQIESKASVASTLDNFGAGFSVGAGFGSTASPSDSHAAHDDVVEDDATNGGARDEGGDVTANNPSRSASDAADHSQRDMPSNTPGNMPTQQQVDEVRARAPEAERTAKAMEGRDAEITAWGRGQADRVKGVQRKAIPGEYREDKKLWQAWLDGYDNIPLK
jgi:recombination protein RecT